MPGNLVGGTDLAYAFGYRSQIKVIDRRFLHWTCEWICVGKILDCGLEELKCDNCWSLLSKTVLCLLSYLQSTYRA